MTMPISRRDVIAAMVLADRSLHSDERAEIEEAARVAAIHADLLIAELDRTAPKAETPQPEAKDTKSKLEKEIVWRGASLRYAYLIPDCDGGLIISLKRPSVFPGIPLITVRLVPAETGDEL